MLDPRDALELAAACSTGASSAPTRVVAKAKETGKFDYDAPIEGLQAIDRYTLRLKLNFPDVRAAVQPDDHRRRAAVAREVVEAYGDGSGWVMANPVGTGPYRLKDWRRGQQIVLEANPGFRDERYPDEQRPRRPARSSRRLEGQAAAADRPHRDQHHRGSQSAAARVRAGRARLPRGAARPRRATCSTRATS